MDWTPLTAESCCKRRRNGTGKEPKQLAKYVVQAERYLEEEGQWVHKFRPMLDAVTGWNQGSDFPGVYLRQEFESHMRALMERVAERQRQWSVSSAISQMQLRA